MRARGPRLIDLTLPAPAEQGGRPTCVLDESDADPQQVSQRLFAARVSTVCRPVNLHRIDQSIVRLTALPLVFPQATQPPCRVMVELAP